MNCKNKRKKRQTHNNAVIKAEQNTQFAAINVARLGSEKGAEKNKGQGFSMGQTATACKALYSLLYSIQMGHASGIKAFSL